MHKWFDFSLFSLCAMAFLGTVLRSKIVFELPFINYNHLLEAHSHFGLGGWATLAIMTMLVRELLPESANNRSLYEWLLGSVLFCAWGMMITFMIWGYNTISTVSTLCFIGLNYFWGWIFLRDLLKKNIDSAVKLLAVCSVICLILSTSGLLAISYIYFSKTFDAFLYRNALFTYLHFLYNGFFTLAIFSILFNHVNQKKDNMTSTRNMRRFAKALCISIIPSLFITYLWQDPNNWIRFIAIIGCFLLLICFYLFLANTASWQTLYKQEKPVVRWLIFISLSSFLLKIFLQGFTVFPVIGNAIFGNRPVIMGFLHMVFLAFVTLFILAYFIQRGILDSKLKWVNAAIYLFIVAVVINELLLLTQGLATMLVAGSAVFPWLLWLTGIVLFAATLLLIFGRIQSRKGQ